MSRVPDHMRIGISHSALSKCSIDNITWDGINTIYGLWRYRVQNTNLEKSIALKSETKSDLKAQTRRNFLPPNVIFQKHIFTLYFQVFSPSKAWSKVLIPQLNWKARVLTSTWSGIYCHSARKSNAGSPMDMISTMGQEAVVGVFFFQGEFSTQSSAFLCLIMARFYVPSYLKQPCICLVLFSEPKAVGNCFSSAPRIMLSLLSFLVADQKIANKKECTRSPGSRLTRVTHAFLNLLRLFLCKAVSLLLLNRTRSMSLERQKG